MKKVTIDPQLKAQIPSYSLAVISFEIEHVGPDEELQAEMVELEKETRLAYTLETLLKEPRIAAGRAAYKTLGKDPSRYRLATEALLRRLIKGNGLYTVNNIVDIGNILSVRTRRSIAVLDEDAIQGDILIRLGKNEPYEGIGRGAINIENLPVYTDELGSFGTPTSDAPRTRITVETKQVLLFITSFEGEEELHEDVRLTIDYYTRYANACNFYFETTD